MAKVTTTNHKDSSGRSLTTTTTKFDTGGSKSITKTQGGLFSSGKIVSTSRTAPKR